jgi:hypothetical protein
VKKRVVASQWFRSVTGAQNTIAGYEAMNMIRKGQVRWLAKDDIVGQAIFVGRTLGIAADTGKHPTTYVPFRVCDTATPSASPPIGIGTNAVGEIESISRSEST